MTREEKAIAKLMQQIKEEQQECWRYERWAWSLYQMWPKEFINVRPELDEYISIPKPSEAEVKRKIMDLTE